MDDRRKFIPANSGRKQDYLLQNPVWDGKALVTKGTRYSIQFLVERYNKGETRPLSNLLKAFDMLKELPYENKKSFAYIAGLHGQPFVTRKDVPEGSYWGGYCHHGNVLFPLWHRAYVNYLEEALQSMLPNEDVMMAYWDEISEKTMDEGIPEIFLRRTVYIDGVEVLNPLRYFQFARNYLDPDQSEGTGGRPTTDNTPRYTTIRFPLRHEDLENQTNVANAQQWNRAYYTVDQLPDSKKTSAEGRLSKNIIDWMTGNLNLEPRFDTIKKKFEECYLIDSYTTFSNTTSRLEASRRTRQSLFSLEDPHNDVHVALGITTPSFMRRRRVLANGDMGDPDTAGFDPIFFFHHCYIDYVFWQWQVKNGQTERLTIDENDPGAKGVVPTPELNPIDTLTTNTPLVPFKKSDTSSEYLTGNDVTDITKLGIDYAEGTPLFPATSLAPKFESLEMPTATIRIPDLKSDPEAPAPSYKTKIEVSNVDRTLISGSFQVAVYLVSGGSSHYVGEESVFNRISTVECHNCMVHRFMSFVFHIPPELVSMASHPDVDIEVEFIGNVLETVQYEAKFIE